MKLYSRNEKLERRLVSLMKHRVPVLDLNHFSRWGVDVDIKSWTEAAARTFPLVSFSMNADRHLLASRTLLERYRPGIFFSRIQTVLFLSWFSMCLRQKLETVLLVQSDTFGFVSVWKWGYSRFHHQMKQINGIVVSRIESVAYARILSLRLLLGQIHEQLVHSLRT